MDKRAFIEALNGDLAYEFQAIIAYTRWAAEADGPHRNMLRSMFMSGQSHLNLHDSMAL